MVLSWLQNFFDRFKKDDEEQVYENYTPEIPKESHFHTIKNENKEMEARITYQYPKGKFRFPIIPDEKTVRAPIERQTVRPKKPVPAPEPKTVIESKKENQAVKKEAAKPKVRSTGPFRPTEIPSPVYGFKRPNDDGEVVEHELSHFSPELISAGGVNSASSEPISSANQEMAAATETVMAEAIANEVIDEVPFGFETVESEIADAEILEEVLEQSEMAESEAEAEAEASFDQEIEIFESETVEEEKDNSVANVLSVEEESVSLSFLEEPEEQTEDGMESATGPVEIEQEKPRRQHLPFNVMMLKSDKQKWQEKRKPVLASPPQKPMEPVKTEIQSNEIADAKIEQGNTSQNVQAETPPSDTDIAKSSADTYIPFAFPDFHLLNPPIAETMDEEWVTLQEELLNQTLQNFNVGAKVVNVTQGPSVTRFEVQPEPGVKVNKVTNLTDDIKLSLAARDIRIEAPIPGKHTIGIEVPNQKSRPVFISEIIQSEVFTQSSSPLTAVLGLDISGKPIVTDLKKMPHGLIAGATGSGKSVCINSILVSLLYKASPEDLKLLLIDPKMVELAPYNRIPHLVSPVITDVKAATAALKWAVDEMERRYELFAHTGVRDISRFNELAVQHKRYSDKLPFIVIIIDELADLMMMSPADVEEAICRIAQKARACGIHLIIATQRPSVDVITGLIKANVPTRIAFSVSSQVDSRTIIDIGGAEKLLGRGDMLFLENGSSKPVRLQGTFVSDEEIDTVVAHVREQREPEYLFEQEELLKKAQISEEEDELFYEACEFVVDQKGASTSSLQRRFKIGYNRAARLMDLMEQQGFISGANGSKPREVFITEADLESIQDAN